MPKRLIIQYSTHCTCAKLTAGTTACTGFNIWWLRVRTHLLSKGSEIDLIPILKLGQCGTSQKSEKEQSYFIEMVPTQRCQGPRSTPLNSKKCLVKSNACLMRKTRSLVFLHLNFLHKAGTMVPKLCRIYWRILVFGLIFEVKKHRKIWSSGCVSDMHWVKSTRPPLSCCPCTVLVSLRGRCNCTFTSNETSNHVPGDLSPR